MNLLVYQTKCITCGWMLSQKGWTARTFTPSKWLPLKPDGHMYSDKCYSTASDEWQSALMPPVHIVMVVRCHKWCDNKKLWKIKIRVVVKQVFKVIWRKATLLHWIVYTLQWVSMFPSPWCPFPCWVCTPISYKVPMLTQVCTPVASWFYAAHPCAQLADTQTTLCAIRRKRPFVSMHFVWVMWPSKIISLDFFTCFFMRLPVAGGIVFQFVHPSCCWLLLLLFTHVTLC